MTAYYVHGQGIDEPISRTTYPLPLTTYYYTFDGLGSVTEITGDSGQIIEKYTYDSFGNLTIRDTSDEILDTSSVGNPYTYTSREYDAETGLYFYRARYYDAGAGRFLTKDPLLVHDNYWGKCSRCEMNFDLSNSLASLLIWDPRRLHSYMYVTNNPINLIDPTGLDWCDDQYYRCLENVAKWSLVCTAAAEFLGLACAASCGVICSAATIPFIPICLFKCLAGCAAAVAAAQALCAIADMKGTADCITDYTNCKRGCKK
ncbi:MAG: RHS repeat-associated core domain-containing protein [Nanoarchaeota archaeon]